MSYVKEVRTIVAISGKQRAGKDSFAAALLSNLPATWRRVGLADAMKIEWLREFACTPYRRGDGLRRLGAWFIETFAWYVAPKLVYHLAEHAHLVDPLIRAWHRRRLRELPLEALSTSQLLSEANDLKNHWPCFRRDLIDFGQARKARDRHVWVKKVLNTPGDIVIPDVRFRRDEVEYLQQAERDGLCRLILIRIEAKREKRCRRGTLSQEDDPTECDLDRFPDWHWVVYNNGEGEETLHDKAESVAHFVMARSQKKGKTFRHSVA